MRAGDRNVACTLFFFSCFYSPFHVDLGKSLGCYRKSIDCNWKRFSLILLNLRSSTLNRGSASLNGGSTSLNGHSTSVNGDFIQV